MKPPRICLVAFASLCLPAYGQGTFIYDQQSAVEGAAQDGGGFIQTNQPFGQSFTPTLSAVGFIRLWLNDVYPGNGIGATLYVNLLSNSITGAVMGSTAPVSLPDSFGDNGSGGYVNFFFPTPVALSSGTPYFFQPVVQVGGDTLLAAGSGFYLYPGGTMYSHGNATLLDLWFREGIVVPEPSSITLFLIGSGLVAWHRRKKYPVQR